MILSPIHFPGNKKRALANGLLEAVTPAPGGRLFDMMVGGGSVLYNAGPVGSIGVDIDERLIEFHRLLSSRVVRAAAGFLAQHDESSDPQGTFYKIRDYVNNLERGRGRTPEWAGGIAALTQLSYNSLWRFSEKSGYNVPYGHGQKVHNIDRLKRAVDAKREGLFRFMLEDDFDNEFMLSDGDLREEDVFYFDPPYLLSAYTYSGWDERKENLLRNRMLGIMYGSPSKLVLSNVAVYRGERNTWLLDWANHYKLNIYVIRGVDYNSWSRAVSTVSKYRGTTEVVITNFVVPELEERKWDEQRN